MTNYFMLKFIGHHMAKHHPGERYIIGRDEIGQWSLDFTGRKRHELRIPVRIPIGSQEVSDYLCSITELIDNFLVDELPWQLWSAYV